MSFVVDTPERQETVDFVDYVYTGAGILVEKGNPHQITGPTDLCGVTTVVGANSQGDRTADALTEECQKNGKLPVDKLAVATPNEIVQALAAKRASAALNVSLMVGHARQNAPDVFDVAGEYFNEMPSGAVFRKDDSELRDAVAHAIRKLQDDGVYQELLTKYGIAEAALEGAPVNATTAGK
jgi:polar amino acid transport system substrate-binding protein